VMVWRNNDREEAEERTYPWPGTRGSSHGGERDEAELIGRKGMMALALTLAG
jgi:hypothetical protein